MPRIIFFQNSPPYAKLLITVGVVILFLLLSSVISLILSILIFHIDFSTLSDPLGNITKPGVLPALNLIQVISAIGGFILPPFLLAFLFSSNIFDFLKLNRKTLVSSMVLVVIMIFVMTPFINWLMELNGRMVLPKFMHGIEEWMRKSEDQNGELTKYFLDMHTIKDLLFNLFMVGLIPAIGEELVFRGVIQRLFGEWFKNKHIAIFVTAAIFSAFHMQFYGFVPRMLLGVVLGYLFVWSGSLWLPMLGHFVNNAAAVIMAYLFSNEISKLDPDKVGTEGSQWILAVVSGMLMIGIMIAIRSIEQYKKKKELVVEPIEINEKFDT